MVKKAIPFGEIKLAPEVLATLNPRRIQGFVHTHRLAQDTVKLITLIPPKIECIVGIPRSGMIPASILATHLDVPLFYLSQQGMQPLPSGSRGRSGVEGKIVLVDDTVCSGRAMIRAKQILQGQDVFACCVYVSPWGEQYVDAFAAQEYGCHWAWNFFNNHGVMRSGVYSDMDGILCDNCPYPDADDGEGIEAYRKWLTVAPPKYLPRSFPLQAIVTARIERFRPETIAWLATWGVKYDRLIMHPSDRASRRGDVGRWKAEHFASSKAVWFVESERHQADVIRIATGKQVICP